MGPHHGVDLVGFEGVTAGPLWTLSEELEVRGTAHGRSVMLTNLQGYILMHVHGTFKKSGFDRLGVVSSGIIILP